MPRFVIPKDVKLIKKADLEMVRAIQRVKTAGKKGVNNSRFEEVYYALIEFGLLVEREVMANSDKATLAKFKKYVVAQEKRYCKMLGLLAANKLSGIHKLLSHGVLVCPLFPANQKRLFVTAAGEKFFRDVKIVLGGE